MDGDMGGASEHGTHARTASKQAELEDQDHQALQASIAAPTFDDVVSAVERATGTPLVGPVREFCQSAWRTHPRGVAMCASEAAMRRGVRTPNGLFVAMLRDGDHVRHDAILEATADERDPGSLVRSVEYRLEQP